MNYSAYGKLARGKKAFVIDSDWAQGRSVFGGLSAALILSHIESRTGLTDRDLRAVNIHFCGPVNAGESCELRCEVLSEGKSVFQLEGRLLQDGQVKVQIVACFSAQRFATLAVTPPLKTFPEKAVPVPFIKGMMPDCMQYMDMKYTSTHVPFSGGSKAEVSGWIRLAEAPDSFDDAVVVTLIDAWPPAVLPLLKGFAPASTITWNIEFIQPRDELAVDDYIYYESEAVQAEFGYAHTEARIYHPGGQLMALSRQVVGVWEKPLSSPES